MEPNVALQNHNQGENVKCSNQNNHVQYSRKHICIKEKPLIKTYNMKLLHFPKQKKT